MYWITYLIKNILKWREENDTYLTRVYGHRWSRKSPVKIEEISGAFSQQCAFHQLYLSILIYYNNTNTILNSSGFKAKYIFLQFSPDSFCSSDVHRRESGRCLLLQLMKATVLAETYWYFFNFHRTLSAPAMSIGMSQVGVDLFPSF